MSFDVWGGGLQEPVDLNDDPRFGFIEAGQYLPLSFAHLIDLYTRIAQGLQVIRH